MRKDPTTYVFIPVLSRNSGGQAVLFRIAALLAELGRKVCLVPRERGTGLPDFAKDLDCVYLSQFKPTAQDLYLVPEGWVNALAPGLAAGASCYVYCQNWAYLFSGMPEGVSWDKLPVKFLAVSQPVSDFIQSALDRPAQVLRPGIDLRLFSPGPEKPQGPLRIAYMPRKNKALAEQIKEFCRARLERAAIETCWSEIKDLDQAGVSEKLRETHIFLLAGFPEGCPLPPLEAMACGCLPVGFTGFGGWDYMRQLEPGTYQPQLELREVDWGGNGYYSPDADVYSAALNLEKAANLWRHGGEALTRALANGRLTAQAYGLDRQKAALAALWDALLGPLA